MATNISVTVVASPVAREERFEPDGAEVVTIGSDQTSRLSAQDLPTALRQVAGVSVSRYSPIGSYGGSQGGSVYVRGTGESRPGSSLSVFQDGVPVMGSFFNHPLLDLNPVDFAETIEVVKGPRPRSVPNAFTAVSMETWRQREEGCSGETDIAYGRFSSLLGSAKAGVKDGAFDFAGGAAYRYSEGKREHSSAELRNAFVRGGVELGEEDYLTFIYRRAESWVEDPGPKTGTVPVRDKFATDMDSYALRLTSAHESFAGSSLVFVTDGRIRWNKDHVFDNNPLSPYGEVNTDWQTWGYRGLYDIFIGDATLSLGLDEIVERGRTRTINGATGRRLSGSRKTDFLTSPYVGLKYDFALGDDWMLTPSVGTRYHFMDDMHGEWAPSAAVTLARKEFGFFASYAEAVHYPGLVFRANTPAWRNLEAEKMRTYTLGAFVKYEDFARLNISAYRNEISNRFDLDAAGVYRNSGECKANGVEATLRVTPARNVAFLAAVAYTIPETPHVSRLPEATSTIGVSWRMSERLHLDVDTQYSSSMYAYATRSANPSSLSKVSAFWTLNVRLALDIDAFAPCGGEIYVACENVFDRHYEYFPGYEMPGAMIYTGVKLRF